MKALNKLFAIKLLHTLIWLFFVIIIFYILYSGVSGNINVVTWIFMGLILGEGIVLVLFNWFCPLTLIARKYSESTKENFDIFLPNWLAKYNKKIFTTIFLFAAVLVLIRTLIK